MSEASSRPVRLRLSRASGFNIQKHSRAVNGLPAVVVARPRKWGNPYRVSDPVYYWADGRQRRDRDKVVQLRPKQATGRLMRRRTGMTAAEAVKRFRDGVRSWFSARDFLELRGKNLACWCALDQPCHADVLLELANGPICEEVAP